MERNSEKKVKKSSKSAILKTPQGTVDYDPRKVSIRDRVFDRIIAVFEKHGAEQIDTPVFELRQTLTEKYGEDSKLIYDLVEFGGELLSLRYDLTVPFARYLASNKIKKMKRFQIAKVYRRDNISVCTGRFREFYQCDFDIAGDYKLLIPDAECLKITCEILSSFEIGKFMIKLNHRKLLDGMMQVCGVPSDLVRTISSAIDKLDKITWEEAAEEMKVKGLNEDIVHKIKQYVNIKGGFEVLDKLKDCDAYSINSNFKDGIDELIVLTDYVKALNIEQFISIDLSMARGLDYYTGLIYEAVIVEYPEILSKSDSTIHSLGSIAAGGRYDGLVDMLSMGSLKVPCVGVSIGVERLMTILDSVLKARNEEVRTTKTQVRVISAPGGSVVSRLKILNLLWDAGIPAETKYTSSSKVTPQLEECAKEGIPFVLIVGESEIQSGKLKIKCMLEKTEIESTFDNLANDLKNLSVK